MLHNPPDHDITLRICVTLNQTQGPHDTCVVFTSYALCKRRLRTYQITLPPGSGARQARRPHTADLTLKMKGVEPESAMDEVKQGGLLLPPQVTLQ
jgi:hypothetical protein